MAQVGIVRREEAFYREYAIELNDFLIDICLRHGRRDWEAIYNLPVNAPFRARFPDPDQIDYVNPVNFFIPLAAAPSSGRARRGRPIPDYYVVRMVDAAGARLTSIPIRIASGATDVAGTSYTTDSHGYVIMDSPAAGAAYFAASNDYEMVVSPATLPTVLLTDIATLPSGHPNAHVPLTRNAITEVRAAAVRYIRCPMCAHDFRVRRTSTTDLARPCPNDAFDLGPIDQAIAADAASYTSPPGGQNPLATPNAVRCRGASVTTGLHGDITTYWDESRFAIANGGDYTLFIAGSTQRIIGRATWGAAAPITGPGRLYPFHTTAVGASPIYASMSIPSNETTQLSGVLKWMTIHHTNQPQYSDAWAPRAIQQYHQVTGIDGSPAADCGYHFVIDAAGNVYEGRPLGIKGSHVERFNGGNVGIVLSGDYQLAISILDGVLTQNADAIPPAMMTALMHLITILAFRFGIRSVWSHRRREIQAGVSRPTLCPGDQLMATIDGYHSIYAGPPP